MKYFIITGSPIIGFRYVGPFDSDAEAEEYRHEYVNGPGWWIAELLAPIQKVVSAK